MSRRTKIYEGKAKILYEGPEPGTIIQYFKDDATAFNAEKKAVLDGKGVLNNRISEYMMLREVIVRNVAAGSMSKRLGIEEGEILPRPIVEFCLKRDDLGDPLVAEEHVTAFGWASPDELEEITELTLRINDYLCGLFAAVGIRLIDFKIEYGRLPVESGHQIVLADEISPDSCRLWDRETNNKMDKDRFRRDMGGVTEAYTEVATRLGIIKENGTNSNVVSLVKNED